jgi:hypothetical protein
MVASRFRDDSAFRVNAGLGGLDSSRVVAVTDSVVCTRVTEVVDSATHSLPVTNSLFVLRAGPLFVGFALGQPGPTQFMVDTAYRFIGAIR